MMKRYLSSCPWLIIVLALLSACGGRPQIAVASDRLELGNVVNGEVVTRELRVQNLGAADLVVERVTTSCGCTQAVVEPATIPPNGSGTLSITFDSGAHGPALTGQLIRQVFITTNDPQQPEVLVELAATILPPAEP